MFEGSISHKKGKIHFDGVDLTEVLLEMFIALKDVTPLKIVINNV
jgi:endonuclease V-like protein UPF0215 family